jgi:hypothetical protein
MTKKTTKTQQTTMQKMTIAPKTTANMAWKMRIAMMVTQMHDLRMVQVWLLSLLPWVPSQFHLAALPPHPLLLLPFPLVLPLLPLELPPDPLHANKTARKLLEPTCRSVSLQWPLLFGASSHK